MAEAMRAARSARNLMVLCADKSGCRLYSALSEEPVRLADVCELLLAGDSILDKLKLPQASTKMRSFAEEPEQAEREQAEKESVSHMAESEITEQKGEKATFVVHVQFRQNSTWQGNLVWAEKKKTKNFRSALELLKLIDSALDES